MLDHSRGVENAQASRAACFILVAAVGHVLQMSLQQWGGFLIGSDWRLWGCHWETQDPLWWFLDHAGSFRSV